MTLEEYLRKYDTTHFSLSVVDVEDVCVLCQIRPDALDMEMEESFECFIEANEIMLPGDRKE